MSFSRLNKSSHAVASLDRAPFAQGRFKRVWLGHYDNGPRKGELCVCKGFKSGSVYEERYFAEEMAVIQRTQQIIDNFNVAKIIDKLVILNNPEVWEKEGLDCEKLLVEPFIQGFQKFNSNSGWASQQGDQWSEAMQALSHFSYHNSQGQILLCDIQGGIYRDGFNLTDPAILSQSGAYGPADLGQSGISDFFSRHKCGRYCRSKWIKPMFRGPAVFSMTQGTTMTTHSTVTPRESRPWLSTRMGHM